MDNATPSVIAVEPFFLHLIEVAGQWTGVDKFRLYTLWRQAQQSAKCSEGALIEVGTAYGGSGLVIAVAARLSGVEDTVYLCDTFQGLVKCGEKDTFYKDGDLKGPTRQIVEDMVKVNRLENVEVREGVFPDTFHLGDMKFRFALIDVDVYQSAKDAFEAIWPRMVPGGILVMDDYLFEHTSGITTLVHELMGMEGARWVLTGNGQAVVVKI